MDAHATATWIAAKMDLAVRGRLAKAAKFFEDKVKQVLNVRAPRVRVVSKLGEVYWRATTPAVKNAPPRRVTGLGRAGFTVKAESKSMLAAFNSARSKTGFPYMDYHEGTVTIGRHPYIRNTFIRFKAELEKIAGFKFKPMRIVMTPGASRPQRRNTGQDVNE